VKNKARTIPGATASCGVDATRFYTSTTRTYEQQATTGKEKVLEATDKKILKTCLVCKRTFLGWFSEKYCSDDCRMEGNRLKARLRKRKSRKVGDLKEGVISQQLGELGLAETQYPMYNHEIVPTMYANFAVYHARDGKRHVRSYYDLLRDIAKLNGTNLRTMLANMAPRDEQN